MLDATPLLDDESACLLQSSVFINVAASTDSGFPVVGRALGCRVSADRRRVVIFFSAECSALLLAELHHQGAIAALFSLPVVPQTIQLKGRNVRFEPLEEGDRALLAGARQAFIAQLVAMGQREDLAAAFLQESRSDVVALSFIPTALAEPIAAAGTGRPWQRHAWH